MLGMLEVVNNELHGRDVVRSRKRGLIFAGAEFTYFMQEYLEEGRYL